MEIVINNVILQISPRRMVIITNFTDYVEKCFIGFFLLGRMITIVFSLQALFLFFFLSVIGLTGLN